MMTTRTSELDVELALASYEALATVADWTGRAEDEEVAMEAYREWQRRSVDRQMGRVVDVDGEAE